MGSFFKCRLCLKLSRSKIDVFKDDFPKMIELLTGIKVNPSDSFPKTSCFDCARDVKSAMVTRKRIINSHKDLLSSLVHDQSQDLIESDITMVHTNSTSNMTTTKMQLQSLKEIHKIEDSFLKTKTITETVVRHGSISKPNNCNYQECKNIWKSEWNQEFPAEHKPEIREEIPVQEQVANNTPIIEDKLEATHRLPEFLNCSDKDSDSQEMITTLSESEGVSEQTQSMNNKDEVQSKSPDEAVEIYFRPKRKIDNVKSVVNFRKKRSAKACTTKPKKSPKKKDGTKLHKKDASTDQEVTCEICKKVVPSRSMNRHMGQHDSNPVACDFCGIINKNATTLRHHVYYHHTKAADEYICEQCGRIFRLRNLFQKHIQREHQGERVKQFECTVCGKKFFENMHLRRHINYTHKKLKPFKCEFCGKDFGRKSSFNLHQSIHRDETPYSCQMCGKSFKFKLSLKNHLKGVHNFEEEKKVFCTKCDKGFATEHALRAHSIVHVAQKCQYCSQYFSNEFMSRHLAEVHAEKLEMQQYGN